MSEHREMTSQIMSLSLMMKMLLQKGEGKKITNYDSTVEQIKEHLQDKEKYCTIVV